MSMPIQFSRKVATDHTNKQPEEEQMQRKGESMVRDVRNYLSSPGPRTKTTSQSIVADTAFGWC